MAHPRTIPAASASRLLLSGYPVGRTPLSRHALQGPANTGKRGFPKRQARRLGLFFVKVLRVHERSLASFACLSLTTLHNKVATQ